MASKAMAKQEAKYNHSVQLGERHEAMLRDLLGAGYEKATDILRDGVELAHQKKFNYDV